MYPSTDWREPLGGCQLHASQNGGRVVEVGGGREVVEGGLVGYPVGGSGWRVNGD